MGLQKKFSFYTASLFRNLNQRTTSQPAVLLKAVLLIHPLSNNVTKRDAMQIIIKFSQVLCKSSFITFLLLLSVLMKALEDHGRLNWSGIASNQNAYPPVSGDASGLMVGNK